MVVAAKVLGMVIAALGLSLFASPQWSAKVFAFFKAGKRLYLAGVIRLVSGFILLLAASQSAVPMAAIALGFLFLVSGIIVFAADIEKMKGFIEYYSQMPGFVIRLLGLVAASFGVLIFSIF